MISSSKSRCRGRDSQKIIFRDESQDQKSLKRNNTFLNSLENENTFEKSAIIPNHSLPAIKILGKNKKNPNLIYHTEDSKLNSKIAQELLIKKTETLMAYRIRLRALLDCEYTNIQEKNLEKNVKIRENTGRTNELGEKNWKNSEILERSSKSCEKNVKNSEIKPNTSLPNKIRLSNVRKNTSAARKSALKMVKIANDPYYYTNIIANPKFTSFISLLGIFYDNLSNFPYCNRVNRDNIRTEFPVFNNNPLLNDVKCLCFTETSAISLKNKENNSKKYILYSPDHIQQYYPYVFKKYFNPQNVTCMSKVFIINIESIYDMKNFWISQKFVKMLKKINPHFHLVLVTQKSVENLTCLLGTLEEIDIFVSGIYEILNFSNKFCKLIDYSSIFKDFECKNPSKDCIILTNHILYEIPELTSQDNIGKKIGNRVRFNINGISIHNNQFERQPVHLVLPDPTFQIDFSYEKLREIFKILIENLNTNFFDRQTLNFEEILNRFESIISDLPFKEVISNPLFFNEKQEKNCDYCMKSIRKKIKFQNLLNSLFIFIV